MAAASCNFPRLLFAKTPPPNHSTTTTTTISPNRLLSPSPPPFPALSLRSSALSATGLPFHWADSGTAIAAVDAAEPAVNPAIKNATVLFCRSGYNVQIVVGEDEPEEALLRRFRREVSKAGVIQECKRRKFFENKQEEKKRKAREAGRRNRRRRFVPRFSSPSSSNADAAPKVRDDVDDNWEMPESDLP